MLQPNDHTLAILHGSQATGRASDRSDWDVAVLADHILTTEERAHARHHFAQELAVPEDAVDVADLQLASPLLRYRVALSGRLLAGNPRDFLAFRLRAWKDHLNNAKFADLAETFLRNAFT